MKSVHTIEHDLETWLGKLSSQHENRWYGFDKNRVYYKVYWYRHGDEKEHRTAVAFVRRRDGMVLRSDSWVKVGRALGLLSDFVYNEKRL